MKPYHPANLKHQPFPHWRVVALSYLAKVLGVQFKINGIPFGAEYDKDRWERYQNTEAGRQCVDGTFKGLN